MVKAAYGSGKPAYGVGPGNVPVYIHRSANVKQAVSRIIQSKTFDHGTICASEQALVVDEAIKPQVIEELRTQGAYFLNEGEKQLVASVLTIGKGMNPKVVGRSPQAIGALSGIRIPDTTRVIIAEEISVGHEYPFSVEKLCPVLAFYTVKDWQEGCRRCIDLLEQGGWAIRLASIAKILWLSRHSVWRNRLRASSSMPERLSEGSARRPRFSRP